MLYVVTQLNDHAWTVNGPFRERATAESAVVAALTAGQCQSAKLVTAAGLRAMAARANGDSLAREMGLLGLSPTVNRRAKLPPPAGQSQAP